MSEEANTTPQTAAIKFGGQDLTIADALRSIQGSGAWFWWVAGLSLINTLAVFLELNYGMALGLAATQIVDALFYYSESGEAIQIGFAARATHLAIVAVVVGSFYWLGRAARSFNVAAFVVGMALYALDSLVFAFAGDWIGFGFHGFVLFMLWNGLALLRAVRSQAPEAFAQPA